MEYKPEEKAEIILYNWFIQHNIKVYFNRKSKKYDGLFDYEIFKVKGKQKKPDFIIYSPCNLQYFAVEVKPGNKGHKIRSGCKILDYYNDYMNGETEYFIDNKKIEISQFLLATDNSMHRKLFADEEVIDNLSSGSEGKKFAVDGSYIPRFEGASSFEFIRQLWFHWKERAGKTGIGIITSDILKRPMPMMFTQVKVPENNPQKWIQTFRRI